ncbi:MAG: hypothetical protein GWN01_01675, partial [Nitrosopumilaceae archaeon]|nr:hypothetical protein [Nitrosopumilaceae archaeon]NIV66664.1 hypothetical protein [Nitrosopumilaceae archaeon]NIX60287.1 hypothetical protein [Nitrosopumilaceae archaeon]
MDKHLLQEAYRTTKKLSGADPVKNFKQVLVDDDAFKTYITGLAEGIDEDKDREKFFML